MKEKRNLAYEITKFCFFNNIFNEEKDDFSSMIDKVEKNMSKQDFIEEVATLINDKININNKVIKRNIKLQYLLNLVDNYKLNLIHSGMNSE